MDCKADTRQTDKARWQQWTAVSSLLGLIIKNDCIVSGTITEDGDRKPWDPRVPMIWDNFSIFRTNCAILTSYIRADPRRCRGLLQGCCHVAWSNGEGWETILRIFQSRQGIRQGIRTRALTCSFMLWANGKGGFFSGSQTRSDFNFALWMKNIFSC